ncbi:MAG: hypothetical protein M0028_05645 [Clostridia bacterium]|nr:hypothetical protein [Clostridia bacterium]
MYWCAVNTKPKNENLAARHLEMKGLKVFLPKIEVIRKRGSAKLTLVEPLFPGYLFVRVPLLLESVSQVNWTPGVRRMLCSGDIPVPVPDSAIKLIQERVGPRDHITLPPENAFPVGTKIAVRHGPFAGLLGVVDKPMSGRGRVRVLLQMLQREMSVECDVIDIDQLPQVSAG